jgi:hypothetical protein
MCVEIDKNMIIIAVMETEYDWFKSYLGHRFQRTGFSVVLSTLKEVQLDVPQGTWAVVICALYQ